MTSRIRSWVAGTLVCVGTVVSGAAMAPAALGAFGVESFVAANCKTGFESCAETAIGEYSFPKEPTLAEAREGGYTQAAGHPAVGITAFKINTVGTFPHEVPTGVVTHIRTDVAPGVSTNPEAVGKCKLNDEEKSPSERKEFRTTEALPDTGLFLQSTCDANTEIGENKVIVAVEEPTPPKEIVDVALKGKVYNLVQPNGLSSLFGVALDLTPLGHPGTFAHTLIEGHIEWAGDYHDYYEIKVSPTLPLIASRLELKGDIGTTGNGGFITNPSNCAGPGPLTTNTVSLESNAGPATRTYTTPIGTEGCLGEAGFVAPPFEPGFALNPETTASDAPDGITAETSLPHDPSPSGIDSSQLKDATVTLPEGMTLNPSAAQGLLACTPAQFGRGTRKAVECPAQSRIGTVQITVPDLPASEPLEGSVYLGGGPTITGQPYLIYVDAESARYGISTRLEGVVKADESTGRLTTTFANNPEQPFSNVKLSFGVRGNALAPIANPLICGNALTETSFVPYTGGPTKTPSAAFTVDNGKGGACASPLAFALAQSTESHPSGGGEATNFTLNLTRADGQQYLAGVHTVLPEGLVGKIPVVTQCAEPGASTGNCPASSQIGTVATKVGSGPTPASFSGAVYLTGPTEGAPFGMTMVVPATVGAFSLGNVIVRTKIEVDAHTARVAVSGKSPTIFKGIPLRLKALSVAITRQGFLINPTNCGPLATESTLTAQQGATQSVSTGFQANGCAALAFKPKFGASTGGKASRANGTSLVTKLNFHPKGVEANVKSVVVQLPKALPSRLSTLNHACLAAVFDANPGNCPANSKVGTARVKTPTLPGQLSGPAYFVSHGGAKFPDLDLVLSGSGVTVILVGNTNINEKTNVTTTSFSSPPDVPFTGFELNLPAGPNSAVAANGNLCKQSLVMPTTITAQNGKVVRQNTRVAVTGCPVVVLSSFTHNRQAVVTVRAPAAGRVSGSGLDLGTRFKHPGAAKKVTLNLPITKAVGHRAIRVRIGFLPKSKKEHSSVAFTTVRF
jgi:hypothetical protein